MALNNTENIDEVTGLDNLDSIDTNVSDIDEKSDVSDTPNEKELLDKINNLEDQLKRTVADFINSKQRIIKDTENTVFQKSSKIILEFLNFKDVLEKAINHEENKSAKNNLIVLNDNYSNILARLNIKKINLKDTEFDFNLAECTQTIKVNEKKKHNKILNVLENTYTYNDKIIKPGKVIIGILEE
jgi:molecular chaperone GrpE